MSDLLELRRQHSDSKHPADSTGLPGEEPKHGTGTAGGTEGHTAKKPCSHSFHHQRASPAPDKASTQSPFRLAPPGFCNTPLSFTPRPTWLQPLGPFLCCFFGDYVSTTCTPPNFLSTFYPQGQWGQLASREG